MAPPAQTMSPAEARQELLRLGVKFRELPPSQGGGNQLGIADPVVLETPVLGLELLDHRGRPLSQYHRTFDVRAAVVVAHFAQWARERGILALLSAGGHVIHRSSDPNVLKVDDHGRGLALDIHGVLTDRSDLGSEVPKSHPPRYRATFARDWRTGRSSASISGGDTAVAQTPEELAQMGPRERLLREVWGFFVGEVSYTVSPANNPAHHDHLHVGLSPTPEQRRQSDKQFLRYLETKPTLRPNRKLPGWVEPDHE